MGFDYFYGFVGGDASQWQPNLFRNTTAIYPFHDNPGWNLETAMADDAIQYMKQLKEVAPDKPFFVYYVPGATHAAPPSYQGVDRQDQRHAPVRRWLEQAARDDLRQPEAARHHARECRTDALAEGPSRNGIRSSFEEKKLFVRQADVYGAYLAYADHEIGRVIQAVEDLGEIDNTLIIYIGGDNGASAEGMLNGTPNEFTTFNGVSVPVKDQFLWYPFWGSERTFPHFAAGWAWAMDTPFKWVKQVPSHFGGTAQGVAMSWPGHITDVGGIRRQFHHVIDIVPTILEATGIPAPETVNGIKQEPIEGVSMAYTWDKANADAPSTAQDAVFRDARQPRASIMKAGSPRPRPSTLPWKLSTETPPDVITGYKWELYNVAEDPTESNDLAARCPTSSRNCRACSTRRRRNTTCFPLDNSTLARWNTPRPSLTAGRTEFTYSGELSGVPASAAPSILNKAYTITAKVEIPEGGAEGVIVTEGGRFGGYGLFLSKGEFGIGRGKVVFALQPARSQAHVLGRPRARARQAHHRLRLQTVEPGLGKGGTGVLSVDGQVVATNTLEHTTPITFPEDEILRCGPRHSHRRDACRIQIRLPFQVHRQDRQANVQLAALNDAALRWIEEDGDEQGAHCLRHCRGADWIGTPASLPPLSAGFCWEKTWPVRRFQWQGWQVWR